LTINDNNKQKETEKKLNQFRRPLSHHKQTKKKEMNKNRKKEEKFNVN